MRVFTVELRRLLKTRSVLVLMLAALILAPVLAYFPASFASWTYRDESGQEVRVEGREALKLEEENRDSSRGRSRRRHWPQPLQDTGTLLQAMRAVSRTASTTSG